MTNQESKIEEQKINCNCNDCIHLVRSFELKQKHEDFHYKLQKNLFDVSRLKFLKSADDQILKAHRGLQTMEQGRSKQKELIKEAKKMNFVFDKGKCTLSYGYCSLNGFGQNELREVSFIPETIQLETQHCFKHRREA